MSGHDRTQGLDNEGFRANHGPMGNIGTERREVEFEPLPDDPPREPDRRPEQEQPEPAPATR